jgi:PST family polysaccharide transporter
MAVPADIVGDILDNVLFPTMARAQNDQPRLARAYRRGVSLIALVMLPSSVAFYLLAPQIVNITLGPKWTATVMPFRLLALGLIFRTSCRMSDALARACGFVYLRAWRQGLYAAFVIGGALVGQYWGVAGAASGVLLALCLNFFLMAQLSLKIADIGWAAFFGLHVPAILLACCSGVAVRASAALMLQWSSPPLVLLAGTTTVMAFTVTALILACPRLFLGRDGLWMIDMLRAQFPALQRFHLPNSMISRLAIKQN